MIRLKQKLSYWLPLSPKLSAVILPFLVIGFIFFPAQSQAADYSIGGVEITGNRYMVKGMADSHSLTISAIGSCTYPAGGTRPDAELRFVAEIWKDGASVTSAVTTYATPPWTGTCLYDVGLNDICYYAMNAVVAIPEADLATGSYDIKVKVTSAPGFNGLSLLYASNDTASFDFTLFSGKLTAGSNHLTFSTITLPGPDYGACSGTPATNVKGLSGYFNGNSYTDATASICTSSSANTDGKSIDLTLTGGDIDIGDYSDETESGFDYQITGTIVNPSNITYSAVYVTLPENITIHETLTGRVDPRGSNTMAFAFVAPVTTPREIKVTRTTPGFIYSYGLPFYTAFTGIGLGFSGTDGIQLTLPANSVLTTDIYSYANMATDDPRRHANGLPTNTSVFRQGAASAMTITKTGLQASIDFKAKAGSVLAAIPSQSHFPRGAIDWDAFSLTITDGVMEKTTIKNFSYSTNFSGTCPDGLCGNMPAGTDYNLTGLTLSLGNDGAYGGFFTDIAKETAWGRYNAIRYTFEKDDTGKSGSLFFPGSLIPKTSASASENEKYSVSQYLFGSRAFETETAIGDHHYLNDTSDTTAKKGNLYFAGITLGPQTLEPSLSAGLSHTISGTDLSVLFNGETVPKDFKVTDYTKYVIRPGGITGVFNTDFAGGISIYGYALELSRFAFRQVMNTMDTETFIDGYLDLPYPAETRVEFSSLDITCTGDFSGGQIENGDAGKSFKYWNTPTILLGMAFENTGDELMCPDPSGRQLRLDSSNQVNGISSRVTLSAFWSPDGKPSQDTITGAVDMVMDSHESGGKAGFSVVLKDGYLNHPPNYTSPEVKGFTNLWMGVDVALFDDVDISGQFENGDVDAGGAVDKSDYSLFLFKNEGDDAGMDGIPDLAAYAGWDFSTYRGKLAAVDETLTPDPRPHCSYSWNGIINLDYPLAYDPSTAEKSPQFRGIKQMKNLPGDANPVIEISSVPDYLLPDKTKLSFGATANVAELQNFHVDLTSLTGDLDSFLSNNLNVSIPIESLLEDLVSSTGNMHAVTGGDITGLIETALDTALDAGPVANGFTTLSGVIRKVHNAPKLLTSQIENKINITRENIENIVLSGLESKINHLFNENAVAMAAFNPEAVAASGLFSLAELDTMQANINQTLSLLRNVKTTLKTLKSQIADIKSSVTDARSTVTGAATDVTDAIAQVTSALNTLNAYTSTSPSENPILGKFNTAKGYINTATGAVKNLNLGDIGDALQQAASLSGGSIDTSMFTDAETFFDEKVSELDQLIADAEGSFNDLIGSAGLGTVFNDAKTRIDYVKTHVTTLQSSVDEIFAMVLDSTDGIVTNGGYIGVLEASLDSSIDFINGAELAMTQDLSATIPATKAEVIAEAQSRLNTMASQLLSILANSGNDIGDQAGIILSGINPDTAFTEIFAGGLLSLISSPFDQVTGALSAQINAVSAQATQFIPDADANDLKELVKGAILNSTPIKQLNTNFYAQFGFISNYVDDLTGEMTKTINHMINETISAVSEGLNEQLAGVSAGIGGTGGGLSGAKLDGYAMVSQDEIERIHIEAEFEFGGKPDPTVYYAALDITSWNVENGKGSACPIDTGGESMFDVVISTKDIKADMLGTSVGIKTASLGFTFLGLEPKGIFGNVYTSGELDFETLVLCDMGLEAGVGAYENYLGAKATGRFDSYTIQAAFFFGKTCDFEVLKRLDKDIEKFIGTHVGFTGVYVRGGAEVPVLNYGCALRVGVGAEIGAWYLTEPSPVYGGMLGGSAYGRVACIASLKGKVILSGTKSGDQYNFYGSGWGAGGVGWCEPSKWNSVSRSRSDSWCKTGDATFEATYNGSWSISGPDINCCY